MSHLSTDRACHRRRRARLIAAGLCTCCGQVPHAEGYRRCEACQERARESSRRYMAKMRKSWRGLGLCDVCGQRQPMPMRCYCGVCAEIQCDRMAAVRAARKQEVA